MDKKEDPHVRLNPWLNQKVEKVMKAQRIGRTKALHWLVRELEQDNKRKGTRIVTLERWKERHQDKLAKIPRGIAQKKTSQPERKRVPADPDFDKYLKDTADFDTSKIAQTQPQSKPEGSTEEQEPRWTEAENWRERIRAGRNAKGELQCLFPDYRKWVYPAIDCKKCRKDGKKDPSLSPHKQCVKLHDLYDLEKEIQIP